MSPQPNELRVPALRAITLHRYWRRRSMRAAVYDVVETDTELFAAVADSGLDFIIQTARH